MASETKAPARQHKATYARDKKTGGYLIRIAGPNANQFAGMEVPVTTISNEEHVEKLKNLVWSGVDTGEYGGKKGEPVALYQFESQPREKETPVF